MTVGEGFPKKNMKLLRVLLLPLIFFLEQWSLLGVAWVLPQIPTTSGFLCASKRTRIVDASRPSHRHVATRVDDYYLQAQIQERDDMVQDNGDLPTVEQTLWSYVNNLQRARKSGDTKAVRSLVSYLQSHQAPKEEVPGLVEVTERALTQALRLSGETGDYRLTIKLVQGAILFAQDQPLLKARIFGEAMTALSQTHANASKLKQMWNLVATIGTTTTPSFLSSPLTAFELNVMLKSLASRGKTRACVDLYHQHTDVNTAQENGVPFIRPDAYSASTIFSILCDSITVGQPLGLPSMFDTPMISEGPRSPLEKSLSTLSNSPCWQWNSAIEIISTLREVSQWNNHAYSSLLKLQDKAQEYIPGHENGPQIAMEIFDSLMNQGIKPDIVTCTLVIKAMGDPATDPSSWKLAVHFLDQLKKDRRLPDPNEYSYSAAIVACARCREYSTAMELLKEMRIGLTGGGTSFVPPKPNTWVYNAVLSAIASLEGRGGKRSNKNAPSTENNNLELALRLLDQMKYDHSHLGMDTLPDTVTYNTILSIRGSGKEMDQVSAIIDEMKAENIPRDIITYRNAIVGCTDASLIIRMLVAAYDDIGINPSERRKNSGTGGKSSQDMTYASNAALATPLLQNNYKRIKEALQFMQDRKIELDSESLAHVITALGRNGKSQMLKGLLDALYHEGVNNVVEGETIASISGLSLTSIRNLKLETLHYASAIEICLLANKLEEARGILSLMREHGISPTSECLQSFALAYAQAAIHASCKASKKHTQSQDPALVAISRADSAYKIATTLKDLALPVHSKVAQACAKTSHFTNARSILRSAHNNLLATGAPLRRRDIEVVRSMHSALIQECARRKNVTAALSYANDIQNFAGLASTRNERVVRRPQHKKAEQSIMASLRESQPSSTGSYVGMRAEDWVALIKAASSSGHWKVCVNTLQFLRPFVERTDPRNRKGADLALLESRYEQLVPALIATCICLEKRSQYAWGERALGEWVNWSGRQPRPEAVMAIVRNLSNRGQGEEVKRLLATYVEDATLAKCTKKGVGYEEMLYIGVITTLHNSGMYDDADEAFISAITQDYLPFVFGKKDDENVFVLDLHGMNVAMAHSAVRVAMRRLASERGSDMMIITGRGRNSELSMRPVLRPEVQRMLLEEFYPPLNTVSVPGNTGALMVYDADISAWQTHQQEQKGARMLALAALLKNASTDRIQTIATKLGASGPVK